MDKNESIERQMLYGLLNNVAVYEQHLNYMIEQLSSARYKDIETDAAIELDALKDLVEAQLTEAKEITTELLKRLDNLPALNEHNQSVIPFTQLIRNNHLREQIRKVERSVFYLKYHVNKLLVKAS